MFARSCHFGGVNRFAGISVLVLVHYSTDVVNNRAGGLLKYW
jgi:hypothetical protein